MEGGYQGKAMTFINYIRLRVKKAVRPLMFRSNDDKKTTRKLKIHQPCKEYGYEFSFQDELVKKGDGTQVKQRCLSVAY